VREDWGEGKVVGGISENYKRYLALRFNRYRKIFVLHALQTPALIRSACCPMHEIVKLFCRVDRTITQELALRLKSQGPCRFWCLGGGDSRNC